jgi:hypothetical protein
MSKKECTGCGQCCLAEKCEAAKIAFGDKDEICPALRFVCEGFYRCLLIEWESFAHGRSLIKKALGIGMGCTNEEREAVRPMGRRWLTEEQYREEQDLMERRDEVGL